jgi:hypothetical protein
VAAQNAILVDTTPHGPYPGRRIEMRMLQLMVEGYGKLNNLDACN